MSDIVIELVTKWNDKFYYNNTIILKMNTIFWCKLYILLGPLYE